MEISAAMTPPLYYQTIFLIMERGPGGEIPPVLKIPVMVDDPLNLPNRN